jgi:ABC-type multidrug transport system fused ATPase/permease subunit
MNKHTTKQHHSFRSFLSFMGQHKGRFWLVMALFAIGDISLAIVPLFIGKLVGALAAHPVQEHRAVVYVFTLIALSIGHDCVWQFADWAYRKLISPLSYDYETLLFQQVIRKPYPYFVGKFTGKISANINTIAQEQRGFFEDLCYNYLTQPISLVAVLAIMTGINWQTGAIFAVGLLCMFLVGRYTIRYSTRTEKRATDVQSTKNAKIIDAIANFVNVKSFHKEATEIKTIMAEEAKTVEATQKSRYWAQIFWLSMSFFVRDIIWPTVIVVNVYLYLHHQLSIGQLTTILSTLLLFSASIWELIWYLSQFNLRLARMEEAHQYLFGEANIIQAEQQQKSALRPGTMFTKTLELKNLQFAYPDKPDTPVLRDLNLVLQHSQKLGIVGKSGSGKSTLTKLLLGYYDVPAGQILLDGKPVDTQEIADVISYVPQDTSLFHRSIGENIAYAANHHVTQADIEKAAELAHADEFIQKISDGYNALVGERGVKLSVGQRQRIAIARAFLDNKPLLILDEATSALDSESELLIQEALENLWKHKTVIAIAHRLSTLRHMDVIAVMDEGQIVELGSHRELLTKEGIYAKLWAHQSGGFIEE